MFHKLFSLLTIILMTTSPAVAQENEVAAAAALDSVIRIFPHYDIVDNFVDEVFKKHKKSASMATRIAKSYYSFVENPETKQRTFYRRDLPRAFSYIDKALAINPKYSKAYIVASDIFFNEAKLDTAQMWLDKGIAVNPTDSALYIESAKLLAFTDPDAAVKKLMVLKQRDSTFHVNLQLGRLYYRLYDKHGMEPLTAMPAIAASYSKAYDSSERSDMTLYDYSYLCLGLQHSPDMGEERYMKMYDVSAYSKELFPKDFGLQHFHLLACLNTKKYDEGIETMEKMKALPDSAKKFKDDDYLWYGSCLAGVKRYDDAIAQYEYVLAMEDAEANRKTLARNAITNTIVNQVKEMVDMGEYEKAIAVIEPALQKSREEGNQNDKLVNELGKLYFTWSSELNGKEKQDALKKTVNVFAEGAEHSDLNTTLFLYQCVNFGESIDQDSEYKDVIILPYAKKLISLLGSKSDMDTGDRGRLSRAYQYMMRYEYFNGFLYRKNKQSKNAALDYAYNVLELDPSQEQAQRFVSILGRK